MGEMFSVRFGADMIAQVRQFARQDGMTVSQWIRKLINRELKSPQRQPAVDVTLYPQSQTAASGALTLEVTMISPGPASWTG